MAAARRQLLRGFRTSAGLGLENPGSEAFFIGSGEVGAPPQLDGGSLFRRRRELPLETSLPPQGRAGQELAAGGQQLAAALKEAREVR